MTRCRRFRQSLNHHPGSKTHFQHTVVWFDLKEVTGPGATISICARHDEATQAPQEALRVPKHTHQNVSRDAHRLIAGLVSHWVASGNAAPSAAPQDSRRHGVEEKEAHIVEAARY